MTNRCLISLKPLTKSDKYLHYRDKAFVNLFGSLKVNPVLPFSVSEFKQESVVRVKGMSISGVQKKASLAIDENNRFKIVTKGGQYILKPSPDEFPFASENEHAAMLISQLLGIETALCGLVCFEQGEKAYITKRYDRHEASMPSHQEDMAQLLGLKPGDKYERSYEEVGLMLDRVTGGKKAVLLDFLKRVIYAYLIGNDDFHLKNISVERLEGNRGLHYDKLTPNYDVLFVQSFPNYQSTEFLAIDLFADDYFTKAYEHYGYYTGSDFIELADKLGLPSKPVLTFFELTERKLPLIEALIMGSFMPDSMKEHAVQTVRDRIKAITTLGDVS